MLSAYREPNTSGEVRSVRREGAGNLLIRAQASVSLLYWRERNESPKGHLVRLNSNEKKIRG